MKISVSSEAVKEKIKSSGHNVKMVMRVLENLDKRDKNEDDYPDNKITYRI